MARATVDDYRIGDVRVRIEFDSGGPVGATTVVSVGEEDGWFVNRWFYFAEDNENYVRNFARKVATDEDYRERCLNRTADWARVADQYEQAARQILQYFRDAGVMGYTMGNKEEEREYRRAKDEMDTICKSVFAALKTEIRGEHTSGDVERIVSDHKDRAWIWLRKNGYLDETMRTDRT
jgi:hypothetical protein